MNKYELEVKEEIQRLSQGSTIHAEETASAKALGWQRVWPVQHKNKGAWVSGAEGARGEEQDRGLRGWEG